MLKFTLHGHACLSIVADDANVLVDPGAFSKLDDVGRPDAMLITHQHADHAEPGYLAQTSAPIYAPHDAIETLREQGISEERLHVVADGAVLTFGSLRISAAVGDHAVIYPGIATPLNASYLVDGRLLVPGDAFPHIGDPNSVEHVLIPIAGPWLKLADAIDFAQRYPSAKVHPIHDALLSAPGIGLTDRILDGVLGERFSRARPEVPIEM